MREPPAGVAESDRHRNLDHDIWSMAWPVMLSYLLANAIELIDIAMVGRLGKDSVAAVGYSAQYYHVVYTVLQSVGIGCIALMARSIGAGRPASARSAFVAALCASFGVALVATGLVLTMPAAFLHALDAKPAIVELATPYFQLIVSSSLMVSVALTFESGYRAQRNTRVPLAIALVTLVVKTTGNFCLMFGWFGLPRLELVGAGLATALSHAVAVALYVWSGRRASIPMALDRLAFATARDRLRELVQVSTPAVGERLVMSVAILTYFSFLSRYGTEAIGAYAIGVRLLSFSWIPGLAFGAAAATLVGQALGAGRVAEARRAGWRSVTFALGLMTALGAACVIGQSRLASVFTQDEQIIAHLGVFMTMLAVSQPFMGIHFTLAGALRGAGATRTPFAAALVGNWVFRVPLAYVVTRWLGWGVVWVWAALVLDHVSRASWLTVAFWRGRWAEHVGRGVEASATEGLDREP